MNFRNIAVNFLLIFTLTGFQSCKCKEKAFKSGDDAIKIETLKIDEIGGQTSLPHILVYKTNKDYTKNVPVIMNAEKTDIISYPAPSDVYFKGVLAYPTKLEDGYLLDNRGIGPNVAFLEYTYENYSVLKQAPEKESLLKKIIDKNPLAELWDCGTRNIGNNEIDFLNSLIRKEFPDCKQLIIVNKTTLEP